MWLGGRHLAWLGAFFLPRTWPRSSRVPPRLTGDGKVTNQETTKGAISNADALKGRFFLTGPVLCVSKNQLAISFHGRERP